MSKIPLLFLWGSMLAPFLSGLFIFKQLNTTLKAFVFFMLFSVFFDLFNTYIGVLYNDNQWVFKIFLICELIFFAWFYHNIFDKPLWNPHINLFFIVCLLLVEVLSFYYAEINDLASWYHFLFFVFFIIQSGYAIIYAFKTFENNIFNYPVFWISFGRLFYFIIISFLFIYPKLFYKTFNNFDINLMSYVINLFANYSMYILFTIGILCLKNQK